MDPKQGDQNHPLYLTLQYIYHKNKKKNLLKHVYFGIVFGNFF